MNIPINYDLTYGVKRWPILGNNKLNDCYETAFENLRSSKAMTGSTPLHKALYRAGFRPPHTPYTEEIYYEYGRSIGEPGTTPNLGTGASQFFNFALNHRLVLGAAAVDITPAIINGTTWQERMRQAMIDFNGGILSVNLSKGVWGQFYSNTEPLDFNPTINPPFIGGHAVAHLRFAGDKDVYITWGKAKVATFDWTEFSRIEYWVCVTEEDVANPNYNVPEALSKIETMIDGRVA